VVGGRQAVGEKHSMVGFRVEFTVWVTQREAGSSTRYLFCDLNFGI